MRPLYPKRKVQKQTKSSAGPRGPAGSRAPRAPRAPGGVVIIIIIIIVVVVVVVVFRSIFTSYYFVQPTSDYTIQGVLRVTTLLHSVLYCKILQRITVTSLQTSPYYKLLFSVLQLYDSVLQGQ